MLLKVLRLGVVLAGFATPVVAQESGGTLAYLVQPEPPTLAGYAVTSAPVGLVTTKIYDGLLEYDFDLKPQPGLAESWSVSEDGLTLSFNLRHGVVFHDGAPFTSADAAFSIEVLSKVHPRGMSTFREVNSIETPDDHTLVLRLSNPAPYVMAALSGYESPMLPRHLLEGTDVRTADLANAPVGTGPFRFVRWERGQYVLMEKNPDYWRDGEPYLDRLVARFVPDSSTRSALLESGEVQLAGLGAVPYNEVAGLAENPNLDVTYKGVEMISPVVELTLNTEAAPLDDQQVRQAIAYAIDRAFVVDNIFFGAGRPAVGPISSNFAPAGFFTNDVIDYARPDRIETANALLDEAGYARKEDGFRFEIVHDVLPYGEEWRRLGEKIQQDLAQIGIKVTLRNEDLASWLRRVYTTYDYQMASNHLFNLADPVIGVHRGFHSNAIVQGTPFVNGSRWSSPETDKLMDDATVEIDPEKRAAMYREVQQRVAEAQPVIYLFELAYPTVVNKNLHNAVTGPLGLYQSLHDAWMEQ